MAEEADRNKRPVARYRAYESTVKLYGKAYRAVVVHNSYHQLQIDIKEVPKYGRGSPKSGEPRQVLRYEYQLAATIKEASEKINPLREEAGCFVLLTNLIDQQEQWPADELLSLYKSQISIEKNFSFLKNPAIVNSIFFKKAERIEVLGLILLISLLIWRLMERSMRLQ
jgi:IS4 transposase